MDNQNSLILIAMSVGALLVVLWVVRRWWREHHQYDLAGKTVLLTGGSRGLGLVMARQLVQQGARLAICARDRAELERARNELEQQGGQVLALPCDVTNQSQVDQMVQQVRDRFGQIDVLINNAGTDLVAPMDVLTMEDYDDLMKLHFWAPLCTTYAVLPEMRQRKAGRIVNISSIGGKVVSPHMLAYCASKFALTGLSEGMRAELAKDGIPVTTVCPGFIRTGVIDHAMFKGQHRKEYTWFSIADSLPLISTSAENVARHTIAAFRHGDAEVIVPLWTWFSAKFFALFPGLNSTLLGWANRLLPGTGGIGTERALGKDSHSFLSPSVLTTLSERAAHRNNEIATEKADGAGANGQVETERSASLVRYAQSHEQVEAQQASATEAESSGITARSPSPEPAIAEDDQSAFPLIEPSHAPAEIQAGLSEIQSTLGIPWTPASWRAYAMYPSVMQLFWERLKPATQTESFLESAIAITERIYRDTSDWYQPGYQIDMDEAQRHQIQRVLNAFTFGNPQLLIQQIALSRTLAGEVVGQEGNGNARRGANSYQHTEIQLIGEQSVREMSAQMQQVYRDIKQTMGVPIVNSDYQALARWSPFFLAAWEDIKRWRERPEYQLLKEDIVRRAEQAASRLRPAVAIGEREVRDLLNNPEDFEQIQQTVEMFKDILPELIVQDALFHMGLANLKPVTTR